MSYREPDTTPPVNLGKKGKVVTDWSTLCALGASLCLGTGMYFNIKSDLRELKAATRNCAPLDGLKNFGTQLQLRNPSLSVPKAEEYLPTDYATERNK